MRESKQEATSLMGAIFAHPTRGIIKLDEADANTLREILAIVWKHACQERRELIRERDLWMDATAARGIR